MGTAVRLRMAHSLAMLELIDLRRARTRDGDLGAAIEKRILDRELNDLERATETEELDVIDCPPRSEMVRLQLGRSVSTLGRIGILVWFMASASAHPGRLDRFGGHSDRREGGYHYHRGVLAGRHYPTEEQALTALRLRQAKVRSSKAEKPAKRLEMSSLKR